MGGGGGEGGAGGAGLETRIAVLPLASTHL